MKSSKILIAAAVCAVLFSGCAQKEVITGIDTSKAGITDFAYDETMSSSTSVSLIWNADQALAAGATSIAVQLAQKEDFSDATFYKPEVSMEPNTPQGQIIQADAAVTDGVIFSGLKEYARFYARVRANYPRSVYSDWTVLKDGDDLACISVGHGLLAMAFVAPKSLNLSAPAYSRIVATWSIVGKADGYAPEWKKSSDSNWTTLGETTEAQAEITELAEQTSYDVRVRAYRDNDGSKEYTDYVTASVTTPEKPAFQPNIEDKDQLLMFFSSIAATAGSSDSYTLEKDVDLEGADIARIEAFAGVFDGKGHEIKNATVSDNLFAVLNGTFSNVKFSGLKLQNSLIGETGDKGVVSGIVLDSDCTATIAEPADALKYGVLVGSNAGTVENCSSAVNIELKYASLPGATCCFGGLVGYTTGVVKGCTAEKGFSISIDEPTSSNYHWIGGVVGQYEGTSGSSVIVNCTNKGDVSVEYGSKAYFHTGGVVGGSPSAASCPGDYGVIEGCTNEGAVSMHYIKGGSGAYPNIGGVVGYTEGYVKGCTNKGKVTLACDHTDGDKATWTAVRMGGVGGTVTRGASDCHNYGTLGFTGNYIAGGTAGARSCGNIATCCFGGVIGAAGPYAVDSSVTFEKCTNNVDIDLTVGSATETPNHHAGGVFGYVTGKIVDCENNNNITFNSPVAINRLGGIAGGCIYDVSGCTNKGNLKVTHAAVLKTDWRAFIGGITADSSKAANPVTYTKCTNSGDLEFVSTATVSTSKVSAVGGIVGGGKSGVTDNFVDCSNTGKLLYTSPATCVTGDMRAGDYN